MAVTGLLLVGFLYAHMIGNLKIFFGAETFDHYAHWLRTIGVPLLPQDWYLWIQRFVLTVAVIGHIVAATILARRARKARPVRYVHRTKVQGSYAARTMRWGGVIILLFVIYHIAQLTFGKFHPDFIEGDVYHNFVTGFQVWWVSAIYIIANLALGMHLYHGLWSMFNSLGLNHARFNAWKRAFATTFAAIVTLANISFPIAVLTGFLH
jgi:succinate dehydrogenase / fumarate reductase, cytochrome b subunit